MQKTCENCKFKDTKICKTCTRNPEYTDMWQIRDEMRCICNLCGYQWNARKDPQQIKECPSCKKRNWRLGAE